MDANPCVLIGSAHLPKTFINYSVMLERTPSEQHAVLTFLRLKPLQGCFDFAYVLNPLATP